MIINLSKVESKVEPSWSTKYSLTYKFYANEFHTMSGRRNTYDWIAYGKSKSDGKWYNMYPRTDYFAPEIISEKKLFTAITAKQFRISDKS